MATQGNYGHEHIIGLAVEQTYGNNTISIQQFGVGSITYTVPIRAATWLLGSCLIGLIAIRRRFKK